MNNIFEKIYCINLDHRVDRWEKCNNFFNSNNINVERFSAIKNENGAVGCALSHLNIIKKAKELNLKNVFIFEDDFEFINYNINLISESFKNLPEDWKLFYLGYNPTEKPIFYKNNLSIIKGAWCTHAYAINHIFYDFIINNFEIPIDVLYKKIQFNCNQVFSTNPCVCIQKNDFSDVDKKFNLNGDIILNNLKLFK